MGSIVLAFPGHAKIWRLGQNPPPPKRMYLSLVLCEASHREHAHHEPEEAEPVAKRRKRGGGGAWRAFVHAESSGKKFNAGRMVELKNDYAALTEEERQHYRYLGSQATALHKADATSFPSHSSRAARARRTHRREAREREAAGPREDLLQLRAAVLTGESVTLPESFLAFLQSNASGAGSDEDWPFHVFDQAIFTMSRSLRLEARTVRHGAPDQSCREGLSQQAMAGGKDLLVGRRRLQELHGAQWLAPPSAAPTLSMAFSAERCPELVRLTPSSSSVLEHQAASATELSASWKQRHLGVQATDCPQVPPFRTRDQSSLCWKAGVCRCKGSGRWLNQFYIALREYVRGLCADVTFKQDLTQGWVVLLWSGCPETSGNALAASSSSSSSMPAATATQIWTHVALQYLQPWKPTLVEMRVISPDGDARSQNMSDLGDGPLQLCVRTTATGEPRMWSVWQFLETLNQELQWKVEAWRLSARLCPSHFNGSVTVFRVPEVARVIWLGPSQRQNPAPGVPVHDVLSEDPVQVAREEEDEAVSGIIRQAFNSLLFPAAEEAQHGDTTIGIAEAIPDDVPGSNLETMAAGVAVAAEAVRVEAVVNLESPGTWGVFKCSLKKPRGTFRGAYEITCPYHRLSEKTLCKKLVTLPSNDAEGKRTALAQARFWAVQAMNFQRQRDHVHLCNYKEDVPSLSQLDEMCLVDPPTSVKTDRALDEEAERGGGGGRGSSRKGVGKGRGQRQAPKAAAVRPAMGSQQNDAEREAALAHAAVLAASDSSDSGSSSSSSSS